MPIIKYPEEYKMEIIDKVVKRQQVEQRHQIEMEHQMRQELDIMNDSNCCCSLCGKDCNPIFQQDKFDAWYGNGTKEYQMVGEWVSDCCEAKVLDIDEDGAVEWTPIFE